MGLGDNLPEKAASNLKDDFVSTDEDFIISAEIHITVFLVLVKALKIGGHVLGPVEVSEVDHDCSSGYFHRITLTT